VIWPHDTGAEHLALVDGDQLIGCVSVTAQPMPGPPVLDRAPERPFHLHSMAIGAAYRGRGYGRMLLEGAIASLRGLRADLVWATARPSAVEFYLRHGFVRGDDLVIPQTGAQMHYVWRVLADGSPFGEH
jgi:ribosomal protein S18 acetylase RimI-like enzyme